jgi:Asp-tRNA(Asn)/Glu-tRNA(Gln) amidotransferase A subunit family amidase
LTHPQDLSLREQAAAVAAGDLDATELLEATLGRIEERDVALNSIAESFASESVRMLSEAPEGPVHGVPVAVKDMFALPWRAPRDGSVRNIHGVGPGESTVYQRLRDAGAVIVAVTNMHEFGIGSTGHVSAYGPCATPWDPVRCAGGSSGGSASAVGGRLVAGSVGTDGGGSIRFPASYCGITGLKLTWGSMPSHGYTHGFSSLGAAGPMCRDAADARLLGEALVGHALEGDLRRGGMRVGVVPELWQNLDPEVEHACRGALDALREHGFEQVELRLEALEHVRIATVVRLTAEGGPASHTEVLDEILDEISPLTRALVKYQALMPATALARADVVRAQLRRSIADAFAQADVLAWPSTPAPAPPIEDSTVNLPAGPVPADFANVGLGGIANLTGVPAISVPCGFTDAGLPVGLQLLAPWSEDARLLDVAELLERATERSFVDAVPPLAAEAHA